jgi:hypothetical protein
MLTRFFIFHTSLHETGAQLGWAGLAALETPFRLG